MRMMNDVQHSLAKGKEKAKTYKDNGKAGEKAEHTFQGEVLRPVGCVLSEVALLLWHNRLFFLLVALKLAL